MPVAAAGLVSPAALHPVGPACKAMDATQLVSVHGANMLSMCWQCRLVCFAGLAHRVYCSHGPIPYNLKRLVD
jgi:hypothetical protein